MHSRNLLSVKEMLTKVWKCRTAMNNCLHVLDSIAINKIPSFPLKSLYSGERIDLSNKFF